MMTKLSFWIAAAIVIHLLTPAKILASDLFPSSYEESRARFRSLCERSAGKCGSFKGPSEKDADLAIATGFFGRGGNRLVVIQSGIHGPEGYAGSAVQALVFERHLKPLLDAGIDVLMI